MFKAMVKSKVFRYPRIPSIAMLSHPIARMLKMLRIEDVILETVSPY